jgi:copper chaperone NosL
MRSGTRLVVPIVAALVVVACGGGAPQPAEFDAAHEACHFCRMTGSDGRTAAQLVAPREEPRFFDDLGCLRDHLRQSAPAAGAVAFVADHRTREWARADTAVFTRIETLATPMNSRLAAHANAASRDADPAAAGGVPVAFADLFPSLAARGGR